MASKFFPAPEVEKIAKELIPLYHKHIIDLSVDVRYSFTEKTPKSKGKEVWGTVKKITGQNAYHAADNPDGEPFFSISISKDVWDALPHLKRVALVDSKLCECWAEVKQAKNEAEADLEAEIEQDNPVKLTLKSADVVEFACIVKRHGLWREEVEELVDAALDAKKTNKSKDEDDDDA
jgi:hypothetical protein